MAKVFVTGGAGFVGSHLVNRISKQNHEVFVLDAFNQYIRPPIGQYYMYNVNYRFRHLIDKAKVLQGDIRNKDNIRRRLLSIRPEHIVHFAALPLANMAIEYSEEAFNTIVGGTVNLLEVLRDVDFLKRFVYISSSMVYGDFEKIPITEDCRKEPKEIYGGMKLSGEHMVKVYSQRYDIPYTIIRPSAVYGPTDNNRRVVGLFLANAILGNTITVKNAVATHLDFTFVEDVVEGIQLATFSDKAQNEVFNITRGKSRSLKELVEVILDLYPTTIVEYIDGNSFRPKRGALDISKARKLLGYASQYDLEEGVAIYAQYLEKALAQTKVKASTFE